MCISRVWRVSTAQNPFIIVVWVAQRAYFMRLEVSAAQSPYNNRGLGGTMCVFHVFGGYRPAKTTIIVNPMLYYAMLACLLAMFKFGEPLEAFWGHSGNCWERSGASVVLF